MSAFTEARAGGVVAVDLEGPGIDAGDITLVASGGPRESDLLPVAVAVEVDPIATSAPVGHEAALLARRHFNSRMQAASARPGRM
jgi:hypothetical protein